jgi:hypothetical protein
LNAVIVQYFDFTHLFPFNHQKTTGSDPKRPKFSDDKDEPCWELEKNRYVKVRVFKGKVGVDIREYYEKDGKLLPGKKGISLNQVQFNKLAEVFDAIKAEVKKH